MVMFGVNVLAVVVATAAAFGFGAIWYMLLAEPWMRAVGWPAEKIAYQKAHGPESRAPFLITFAAELVMAVVLAAAIGETGQVTIADGILAGMVLWLGLVVTTIAVNNAYAGRPAALTVIDGLHWLGVLAIQGATIGAFGR